MELTGMRLKTLNTEKAKKFTHSRPAHKEENNVGFKIK